MTNTVRTGFGEPVGNEVNISDIVGVNFDNSKTAFWGRFCDKDIAQLYLVSYSCILLADNPRRTWTPPGKITVLKWVDVEISVI